RAGAAATPDGGAQRALPQAPRRAGRLGVGAALVRPLLGHHHRRHGGLRARRGGHPVAPLPGRHAGAGADGGPRRGRHRGRVRHHGRGRHDGGDADTDGRAGAHAAHPRRRPRRRRRTPGLPRHRDPRRPPPALGRARRRAGAGEQRGRDPVGRGGRGDGPRRGHAPLAGVRVAAAGGPDPPHHAPERAAPPRLPPGRRRPPRRRGADALTMADTPAGSVIQDALDALRRLDATPADAVSEAEAEALVERLRPAVRALARAYYVEDRPLVSDAEYDRLFRALQTLEARFPRLQAPDPPPLRVGGEPLEAFEKVRHPVPLLSLRNAFDADELRAWYARVCRGLAGALADGERPALEAELKIDGLAVALTYEGGRLARGATRGNGV